MNAVPKTIQKSPTFRDLTVFNSQNKYDASTIEFKKSNTNNQMDLFFSIGELSKMEQPKQACNRQSSQKNQDLINEYLNTVSNLSSQEQSKKRRIYREVANLYKMQNNNSLAIKYLLKAQNFSQAGMLALNSGELKKALLCFWADVIDMDNPLKNNEFIAQKKQSNKGNINLCVAEMEKQGMALSRTDRAMLVDICEWAERQDLIKAIICIIGNTTNMTDETVD